MIDRWNLPARVSGCQTNTQHSTLFFLSSKMVHNTFPVHMHTNAKGDYVFVERYFPGLFAGSA